MVVFYVALSCNRSMSYIPKISIKFGTHRSMGMNKDLLIAISIRDVHQNCRAIDVFISRVTVSQ